MSKVYSFRLDDNNPREAQAREVMNAWISKGYSLRQVVVQALINVSNYSESKDIGLLVEKLRILLEKVEQGDIPLKAVENKDIMLPSSFLESVSKTLKPGVKIISS